MSFQPGQTVRWAFSLRDADWPSISTPSPRCIPCRGDGALDDPEVYRLNPVGRVLKVDVERDPGAVSYCGDLRAARLALPRPVRPGGLLGGTEGMVYAEHELEPA